MNEWPQVIDEFTTLKEILSGKSITRYGDGELKLCLMKDCISQVADKNLADEMLNILKAPREDCIVALPYLAKESPKAYFWKKVCTKSSYMEFFREEIPYYSQFITRPDSAPWINTKQFWDDVCNLWDDKEVILVAGSDRSLTPDLLKTAKSVYHIKCLYRDTYQIIDDLEKECLSRPEQIVLLCCGATATALAYRLADKKQALDLGHIGMFKKMIRETGCTKI